MWEIFIGLSLFIGMGAMTYAIFRLIRQERAQRVAQEIADDNSPVETITARMVTKQTQTSGYMMPNIPSSAITSYCCTFEFSNGARREFMVAVDQFDLLVEGDEGQVTFQGSRYKGFQREGAPALNL